MYVQVELPISYRPYDAMGTARRLLSNGMEQCKSPRSKIVEYINKEMTPAEYERHVCRILRENDFCVERNHAFTIPESINLQQSLRDGLLTIKDLTEAQRRAIEAAIIKLSGQESNCYIDMVITDNKGIPKVAVECKRWQGDGTPEALVKVYRDKLVLGIPVVIAISRHPRHSDGKYFAPGQQRIFEAIGVPIVTVPFEPTPDDIKQLVGAVSLSGAMEFEDFLANLREIVSRATIVFGADRPVLKCLLEVLKNPKPK